MRSFFVDDANVLPPMSLVYIVIHQFDDERQASPNSGEERIWLIGIILRAMTSADENVIVQYPKWIKQTHTGTGFMHNSFYKDDCNDNTRKCFDWQIPYLMS